jgi:hypothetical protein
MTQNEENSVTTATPEKTDWSMAELRECKRSLYVRNDSPLFWTLHETVGGGRLDLELKPGQISYLPPWGLDAAGIARNKSAGKITVSPDLEEEMMAKMAGSSSVRDKVLSKYQIQVQEGPQARAMDVNAKVRDVIAESQGRTKGIVPQGMQRASTVDEFNSPQPFKTDDGRWFDPQTAQFIERPDSAPAAPIDDTGIASVTITRPARLQEGQ